MVQLISALLFLAAGAGATSDSPNIWFMARRGKLTRGGREGEPLQRFDISAERGPIVFRGRQIAFESDGALAWVTAANSLEKAPAGGRRVVGWRDNEPLVWSGMTLTTVAGVDLGAEVRSGDTPQFAVFFGESGTIVSQTSAGGLRVQVTGSHPLVADFGKWRLVEARMVTASSGYLLAEGEGSAVIRVAKGRADIVALDRVFKLGIAIASDGQAYVTRLADSESDTPNAVTDVLKVGLIGALDRHNACQIRGHIRVIDLDPEKMNVYGFGAGEKSVRYARFSYRTDYPENVLQQEVEFVLPAFGGPGFIANTGGG